MNITATPKQPVTVYYCKSNLATGLTVRVLHAGSVHNTAGVEFTGASGSMVHGNSRGKAKASGARCVLQLTGGTITLP